MVKTGDWMAVRPGGTEPKIKIYYSLKGNDEKEARAKFADFKTRWEKELGL